MQQDTRPYRMHRHFSDVATSYNELRTTDSEPIRYIADELARGRSLTGIDIGCGSGRYSLLLLQHLPELQLICCDANEAMLAETTRYLEDHGVRSFSVLHSDIENLQLAENSYDCIFTFNAIHHFDAVAFLGKAASALRQNGHVFIYTRLKSQNAGNIWGRFFPGFKEKETRLYELSEIRSWDESAHPISLSAIEAFTFKRAAALEHLVRQAQGKHYSTFSLFSADEFQCSLAEFRENIRQNFADTTRVEWFDENVMISFRRD
ncbi:MAG: class I SAM-dependent methyltransferase [Acidiferrobacterales bacterium]